MRNQRSEGAFGILGLFSSSAISSLARPPSVSLPPPARFVFQAASRRANPRRGHKATPDPSFRLLFLRGFLVLLRKSELPLDGIAGSRIGKAERPHVVKSSNALFQMISFSSALCANQYLRFAYLAYFNKCFQTKTLPSENVGSARFSPSKDAARGSPVSFGV